MSVRPVRLGQHVVADEKAAGFDEGEGGVKGLVLSRPRVREDEIIGPRRRRAQECKAVVEDDSALWVAKFNRQDDRWNNARVEHAMLRLARTLKLGKIDVLGYHTGSATAVEMALQSPATVQKLVILGASLLNDAELADFKARYVGRQIDDIPGAFARRWPVFRDKDWRMVASPARQMNILLDSFRNPDVSHWGHRAALNYPLTEKMRALPQKTLVINPEDDLWAYTGRAADLLKNVKVQAYPGWTHGFLDTKASEVSVLIETFLQT